MDGKITEIDTVSLDEANKALVIIDQTKLPGIGTIVQRNFLFGR